LEVTGVVPGPVQIPVPAAPTQPRTIACVSSSDPEEPAPSEPTVIDETGYIAFCAARTTTETAHEGIVVSNPIDLQWTLDVRWSGTPCDLASTFTFSPAGDHFELVGQRPDRSCDEPLVQHQIELFAYGPMPAHMVSASFSSTPAPAP
jgi:hypothetical protein